MRSEIADLGGGGLLIVLVGLTFQRPIAAALEAVAAVQEPVSRLQFGNVAKDAVPWSGSTFNAHHLRIAVVAVNTNLAAAAGSLVALLLVYFRTRRWDIGMALNGVLGGLVAVTAPAAWIEAWAAAVIGAVAGLVVVGGVYFLEARRVDDPVGAISVHAFNGIWGLISLGLFADGTYGLYSTEAPYVVGLFYGGGTGQLLAQLIGAAVASAWAFGLGFVLFKVMDLAFGIRVSPQEELQGLDLVEHGTPAYPEFSRRRITSLGA